ncbi:MAG: hypothetical protein ACREOI_10170 [bacterium]
MATSKPYPDQETPPATQSDKVAEAVSPYIARSETRRGVTPTKVKPLVIAGLPASEEVWRFAQENSLAPHIETAIRLLRESFKEIRNIRLEYEIDYEIPHWNSINIHLDVTGTMEELLCADEKYRRAFTTTVPDEHQFKICLLLWPEVKDGNSTEVIN